MELLNKCKIEIDTTTCSKLWSTTMYYLIILNVVQQMLYQLRCGMVLIGLLPKKMQTGRGLRIEKTIYNCHFTLRNSRENENKKLYGPFLRMRFNCLKARAASRR